MIRYQRLVPSQKEALIRCVQASFPLDEPMAVSLGLSLDAYYAYTKKVCERAVSDNLTIVATTEHHGILGFCINEDLASAPSYSQEPIHPKMLPLVAFLEELDHRYFEKRGKPIAGEVFHLYMLGVAPAFRRQGMARELLEQSFRVARSAHFQSAVAEATGVHSQAMLKSLEFTEVAKVDYPSFQYHGQRPFALLEKPASCKLMELQF